MTRPSAGPGGPGVTRRPRGPAERRAGAGARPGVWWWSAALSAGALAACTPAAAPAPAVASPAGAATAAAPVAGPDLCARLCALGPTAATPLAPAIRGKLAWSEADGPGRDDDALVLLFWKEPNGEGIEALSGFNDLGHALAGLAGVRLAVVHVGGDVAQAMQARRELIDADVKVALLAGEAAQGLVAALAPDRLPATYVLDRRHRPQARFDGVARWRSPSVRGYFEGLVAGGGCGLSFEGPGAEGRCAAAGP